MSEENQLEALEQPSSEKKWEEMGSEGKRYRINRNWRERSRARGKLRHGMSYFRWDSQRKEDKDEVRGSTPSPLRKYGHNMNVTGRRRACTGRKIGAGRPWEKRRPARRSLGLCQLAKLVGARGKREGGGAWEGEVWFCTVTTKTPCAPPTRSVRFWWWGSDGGIARGLKRQGKQRLSRHGAHPLLSRWDARASND